ncbi:hypothetical protein Zmor_013720 [Zophobas morio]|uniref:Gustatory receptor n=1 Tax=Zophobas morio TaxID=2755281 RepID=A0AA38IG04_9CUCU|nr:hypothetical protein Zmor_013720 [Zophobas morio]
MSTAYVVRVKQFTTKLEILLRAQAKNPLIWKQMRGEYYRVYNLCCLLNDKLSYIILVSYGTNLYFILVQLFGTLRPNIGVIRKTYYYISLVLLVLRLVCVTLYGASVNSESKKVLPLLFSVSSKAYNKEVDRLIDQVIKNRIVISVKNFFKITKTLILQLAGAVVTYELVLIQFNSQLLNVDDEQQENNYSNNTCE